LPPKPKIFHGRESELKHVMELVAKDTPRIVILGGGGMGKTSLAKAALHHSETCTKFQVRFFVSAEAATTAVELAALVGLHLGLEPGSNLINPVVQYFTQQTSPCLLVLDNLETPWEPLLARGEVEEFLSLLADVHHLVLMITMRGSERPHKGRWTQPFLPPLEPLSDEAALQILEEITDDPHLTKEKRELLQFTGNMPLALDLIAHLVEYEGISKVLACWKTEKTNLLSMGYDRTSNMDTSIALSLSSPRITSGSRELLSLLSILPDGLSDAELIESNLPIDNILSCKSVLIATSLAYKDTKGRLRSLVPIREHVQCFFPPAEILVESL
ncbi:P-loop containing nucleoside triphosphate hydrolase protein, partial [Mycena filopes]